jgi:hypothetical protein
MQKDEDSLRRLAKKNGLRFEVRGKHFGRGTRTWVLLDGTHVVRQWTTLEDAQHDCGIIFGHPEGWEEGLAKLIEVSPLEWQPSTVFRSNCGDYMVMPIESFFDYRVSWYAFFYDDGTWHSLPRMVDHDTAEGAIEEVRKYREYRKRISGA